MQHRRLPSRPEMMSTSPGAARLVLAMVAMIAFGLPATGTATPGHGGAAQECAPGVQTQGFSDALDKRTFAETAVGGLSDLVYDRQRDVYYAVLDNHGTSPARFYTLRMPVTASAPGDSSLGEPVILDVTVLRDASGQPFTGANFDGEGLALTHDDELLVSSETEPSIRRFALDGSLLGQLTVPDKFLVAPLGRAQHNRTFESLALTGNGHTMYTAVEGPLSGDEKTAQGRNRVRILRYGNHGPGGFAPTSEFFYLTEPGQFVTEIVALSRRHLLVLERGYEPGRGNTVRIFQVRLDNATDVSGETTLAEPGLAPVRKHLLVNIGDCPPGGARSPGTQQNPLLDNYEGLTLGPRLSAGRRMLLTISDDNFNDSQVTRALALAVTQRSLVS